MIRNLATFIFYAITCLILIIGSANSQNVIKKNKELVIFPIIEQNLLIKFPKDHGSHDQYRVEWWYLTANLKDQNGEPLGLQWTLFRADLEAENRKNGWNNSQIWMGHAALTNRDSHMFHEKIARGGVFQANVTTEPFEAWIDDWYLKGIDWKNLTVSASGKNFKYVLKLEAKGPLVKHGDEGRSIKSSLGLASAYYSQPFFHAQGWIEQDGKRQLVSGSAWADHEWSNQFITDTQDGWDWFSLNFDSGEKLMLFQVREKDQNYYYAGTWMNASGSYPLDPSQILIQPIEPKSDAHYYTNWTIKIKNLNLDIDIEAINPSSKMNTIYPYWEGPISFNGSHSGNGYLEMTGYIN
ncbi:MAG: lipocalin-like domain-containing protein [Paracoccaceae bacterium]|nr:lipocalin-like domain-containing protein [Paracoccaceae bacterium]